MTTFLPYSVAKALQWEIAKGHLRAMPAIDGACSTSEIERSFKFERAHAAIEEFIKEFESAGLHEGDD